MKKTSQMQNLGDMLVLFNPLEDKFISREFQAYGYHLAEELNDLKHRSIYIKLAKTIPRSLLEKAYSYTKDANVKRKGALFMWKLKQMGAWDDSKKSRDAKAKKELIKEIPF